MEAGDFQTVGVVGCGLMGAGIVETFSKSGFKVIVCEVNPAFLEKGLMSIRSSMVRSVEKGRLLQAEMDSSLGRITGTTRPGDLAACDLVVEAVVENMALKKELFANLDAICKAETVLASNTSSLSITEIAAATRRPEKVLGLHFFNPVPVMPLIEIVAGLRTAPEQVALARALGEKLGKTCVVVRDRPGFIVNLLMIPFLLDAIRWLDAGLATKEEIDAAVKLGLNHPMGPIALSDFVGLDTVLLIADALYAEFHEARYSAPPLLRRMVTAGLIGKKAGAGFFNYVK